MGCASADRGGYLPFSFESYLDTKTIAQKNPFKTSAVEYLILDTIIFRLFVSHAF